MPLTAGTRLGSHEILGPLGAGGMGEVYLARDTRLDREVALKLLPRHLTTDADAIARFRREALTLASLSHPNIATVHGFEETPEGPMVLVLERVEGETLAERLSRGALAPDEALQICAQIAQALEAAHERGVIHRDVKPGNVMIGPRGLVKVLDFGLARRTVGVRKPAAAEPARPESPAALTPAAAPSEEAETIVVSRPGGAPDAAGLSQSGTILGTPGYMSPEQVLAVEVDPRTDVFAFGCVLYECLAGRRAFSGGDALAIMAATLNRPPDLAVLPASTPPRVRTLIARCLEQDVSRRLDHIRSARVELEEALGIRRASALREGERYATPHNLPAQTTTFIGRSSVLDECRRLLGAARLLTLAGLGGTGKTRIALRLAESLLGEYPDGVWFVNLAPVTDSGRVADVAAEALGVPDQPGRTPLESLTRHVRDRRMLFVVDNCEEVLGGAAALASAVLRACPASRVLATSRQALGLEGETVLAVPPLEVPSAGGVTEVEPLRDCEAVQLFMERAIAAKPDFALTTANAPAIAELCRRLDGIPLALELAAGRIRMLGVEQIRDRLEDRFKLLARPGSDAPSRRQTVKAVIQWSWDHLLRPEQDLMRRLAVFKGGWTLERATAVCSESGDEFEVLDLLTRLVERSLVVVDRSASGEARYRFLESVWRFALDALDAHGEAAALRERHLAVYLDLGARAEKAMSGPGMARQVAELAREEENILAALETSGDAVDGAIRGLRLATAVQRFWSASGRYTLGRRTLETVLGRVEARKPTPERAWALVRTSGFALIAGEHEVARRYLEESLAYWRAHPEPGGLPPAVLAGLGVVAMWQSRYQDAHALGEESLALYQARGSKRGVAMALHNQGTIECVLGRGDHGRACFEAALGLLRETRDENVETLCLSGLATSLVRQGELAPARQRLREGFALLDRLDTPRERLTALEALAELAVALGRPVEAARLIGAADATREALVVPLMPAEKADIERLVARITEALGADEAERAQAAGRKASPESVRTEVGALLDMQ
ncbi:MAG: hypothetical protein E6K81_02895 [Candidatus Eisenbacteria bacterium]|uniref:Protein kinase domain-containing protein n=1 Tax=Eiseniibacteriota bacterium TaxID=2212470 RepID=A0A538UD63_UNCEI|nr:MAG: hypothetical protein E6K81_02895 [Candidatus Eisenbacteria bacterium]